MDNTTTWTAVAALHYTKQNNGNLQTPVTLEHVMKWIEKYNKPNQKESSLKITSSDLF
jgi:hypothetical protein